MGGARSYVRDSPKVRRSILHELAFHQYADSILWIPMLAQMKSKATSSRRLRRAIEENIAHEAGLEGTSHVTLAVAMMRSLGIRSVDPFPLSIFAESAGEWLSDAFARYEEPEVVGWLLTAESLVPRMFAAMVPAFEALGCDARYFVEHVAVDSDEHATWMAESVVDVVEIHGPTCIPRIEEGMASAWAETREVPDMLWKR